jgi:hypothetical protein
VVKEGVNSGNQGGEGNYLARHLEVEAGWSEWPREAAAWPGSASARWKMKLTGRARLALTEGEGVVAGLRKREEKTSFGQYANVAQAGMGRARARGLREKRRRGRWPAGRRGRAGRLGAGPNAKEKFFSE